MYLTHELIFLFIIKVEVPPEYHRQIIGKKGAVISKLRDDFQVNITMPKPEDPNPGLIIIKGNSIIFMEYVVCLCVTETCCS